MQLFYKAEAIRKLKRLGPAEKKKVKKKVKKKIENLLFNPLSGKYLKGEFGGLWSLKAWPVRIIYMFDAKLKMITIITIDYRGSVYK